MEKPSNLRVAEFEENLIKMINDSNLAAFALRPIFERAYNQIIDLERRQLEASRIEYEESLKQEKVGEDINDRHKI